MLSFQSILMLTITKNHLLSLQDGMKAENQKENEFVVSVEDDEFPIE